MITKYQRKATELNARNLELNFSPAVKQAFADLEAAVHFSKHFDNSIREILQGWAAGKSTTVHDYMISFPTIAEQTFKHIQATGDKRAEEAWETICEQMPERGGFTITQAPVRDKSV